MPDQTIHADQLLDHADHILSAEEQITKLHEQLADAHAAGARSATDAANLREQLDRANTERQRLADELATEVQAHRDVQHGLRVMTEVARSNKQHVATLTAIVERVSTLVDRLHREGLATVHTEELCQALNAPAARPGSSRHAQDAHVIRAVWEALCDALVRYGYVERPNLPGLPLAAAFTEALAELGYGVVGSSRRAQEDPSAPPPGWGYMARVDQLLQRVRPLIAGPVPVVSFAEIAEAADRVDEERAKLTPAGITRAGWDPSSPQWAVMRAAIAWRRMRADTPTTPKPEAAALIQAVDALPHIGETDRPRIVVLCGSTRFRTEIADANRRFTLDSYIVLAPGVFGHDGDQVTDEQKEALDDLHFRKIDLADEVYVVNPYGYIGESTRLEMSYARRTGKPVRRLVENTVTLPTYGDDAPATLRSRP